MSPFLCPGLSNPRPTVNRALHSTHVFRTSIKGPCLLINIDFLGLFLLFAQYSLKDFIHSGKMLLTFILLSLSLLTTSISSAAAAKKYPYYKPVRKRSCLTKEPSVDLTSQHAWLMNNEQDDNEYWNGTMIQDHLERYHPSKVRSLSLRDIPDPYVHRRDASIQYLYTVDVWVHVVMMASDNYYTSPYYVTKGMITNQMNYLNNMYAGASISYNLLGITWTVNDTWAANGDDLNMKRTLRKGTYSTLNIYYQTHLRTSNDTNTGIPPGSILLGFCCTYELKV